MEIAPSDEGEGENRHLGVSRAMSANAIVSHSVRKTVL